MQIYIVFSIFATKNTKIFVFDVKFFYNVTILAVFGRFWPIRYIIFDLFPIFASETNFIDRYFLFVSRLMCFAPGCDSDFTPFLCGVFSIKKRRHDIVFVPTREQEGTHISCSLRL